MAVRIPKGRKLLVASLGVAAVSYACGQKSPPEVTGNLMARPEAPELDAGAEQPQPPPQPPEMTGNLMPPPPPEPPPATDAGAPLKKAK